MSKFTLYTVGSVVATGGMVYQAAQTHKYYFPAAMSLVHSRVFSVLLANDAVLFSLWVFLTLRYVFFGRVIDREWNGVVETLTFHAIQTLFALSYLHFAMTPTTLFLLGATMITKAVHLLASARLDTLEQVAQIPRKDGVRFLTLLFTLFHADMGMMYVASSHIMESGFDVWVVLALDWALMLVNASVLIARFLLHLRDRHLHRRSIAAKFYIQLVAVFMQCTLELVFFGVLWSRVGPPLHLIRELYLTVRTMTTTLASVVQYRKNCAVVERLAVPTEAEIQRDNSCVICMEDMDNQGVEGSRSTRRLPCGHVLHTHCLYRLVEKDKNCPTCRRDFTRPTGAPPTPNQGPASPPVRPVVAPQQQPPPAPRQNNAAPAAAAASPAAAPPPPATATAAASTPVDNGPTDEEMEAAFLEYQRWSSQRSLSQASSSFADTTPVRPSTTVAAPSAAVPRAPVASAMTSTSTVATSATMSVGQVRAYRVYHESVANALAQLEEALQREQQR